MNCILQSDAKKPSTFLGQVSRTASFTLMLLFSFLTFQTANSQILINEFMASNGTTILDPADGVADDWIEIYNAGNSSVNIGGYYITDDLTSLTEWQIPSNNPSATTIPAGGYLILWADKEPAQGTTHVNIKLGSGGEDLALIGSNGTTIIDSYTFGPQLQDVSEGRTPNGGSSFGFFTDPTPGSVNNTPSGIDQVAPVTFSQQGGVFTSSQTITLSTATSGADIYYTTDGSVPTQSSTEYTGPITVNTSSPIRAVAFNGPQVPSATSTTTFLFNVSHTFPILAYSADPDEMFDPTIGIYPNWEDDIEIAVNAELYEPDGTLGFNQIIESEVQGTGSASSPQKPLALKAKSSLGSDIIPYQVFPDLPFTEMRSLTLRNSGQDWNYTMFRDAFASSIVTNLTDVGSEILAPEIYGQGYRPGVVYINGEYWGIHNIRERMDKRYLKVHFDLDDTEVDFLENKSEVREGDLENWDALEAFYETTDFSNDANFATLADWVDVDHYKDYVVHQLYIDAQDWPGNNNRRWRKRADGEKWRWMTWDLDFSFGLFVPGNPYNSGVWTSNSLQRLLQPNGFNWPNPTWSTEMFNQMLENEGWRHDFINRMADQLNILYAPSRMNNRIDEFVSSYQPEIQKHHDRWSGGFQQWDAHVQKLRNFSTNRAGVVRNHFVSGFSEVTGTTNVTINLNSSSNGQVDFSTIAVSAANAPFTGVYFRGVDIPVQAFPNRGYILQSWSGALSGNDPTESIKIFGGSASITANFIKGSTSTGNIVINEINYNSPDAPNPEDWVELHNPTGSAINVSGWYFEDEGGNFFGLPANTIIPAGGYLVLAEDGDSFSSVYPGVDFIGDFGQDPRGFGLSGGGELITLKNANGVLIDEVEYDDKAPWPTEPDGDGPTLQLTNPFLNNALASSWQGIPATPGAENGTTTGSSNQTINFSSISNKLTTDDPFTISATATSGLPVSFTILSGPASVSGNTITLNGTAGTVTVRASQAGNAQWNAAPNVNRTFNVTAPNTGGGDCDDIVATTSGSSITIAGVNSAHHIVKIFGNAYNTIYDEVDGSVPVTVNGLVSEVHHLNIQLYNAQWQFICTYTEDITVGGGTSSSISINCPQSVTVQIPSGATTATVNYSAATATTNCPSNGLSVSKISGPNSGSSLTAGSYIVTYEATDNCNNTETCNINITVLPPDVTPPGSYCEARGEQPWQEWIAGVSIATINNPSGKCDVICGYSDFTNLSTSVNAGSSYPVTLTPGKSWVGHPSDLYWRVWIDYNQDGDFSDAGEMVLQSNGGNQNVNQNIAISGAAATGSTRMRVAAKKGAYASPCENFLKGEVEDYTLNISGGGGGGVLTINCPSNITVTAGAGASTANVSYNAATANSTCTTGAVNVSRISGPSSGSAFPLGTTIVTYGATDGCSNEEFCSFTVTVNTGGSTGSYCAASGSQPWQQWIQKVTFAGINNTTGKDQYGDYTNLSASIGAGEGRTISLTPGFSWNQTDVYFRVWIDYNQDGDFNDANEQVASVIRPAGTPPTTSTVTRLISVPNNASGGNTRMRVAMQSGSYPSACGTFTLGEVEDYTINITGSIFVYTNPDAEYIVLNTAKDQGSVALSWVTNTEYKNDYFVVERSNDGINFEAIIDVEPFGELVSTAVYYQEKDELPSLGVNFYRVKQYFTDGTFVYSNLQEMVFEIDPSQIAVFPNPTANEIYLSIPDLVGQQAEISIYNQLGQEMTNQKVDRLTEEAIRFDLSTYRGGMYLMTIQIENQKIISRKFIVTKF